MITLLILPVFFEHAAVRKNIDKNSSVLSWKGTKLGGSGKHEGTLRISDGYLVFDGGQITGGKFTVDMNSIRITDIPAHEIIPIKNLTDHLKSELETGRYKTAGFTITHAVFTAQNQVKITGLMRIKNRSKTIAFMANVQRSGNMIVGLNTTFLIDRFEWNIGNNGSWLEKRLVDKDIRIQIFISLK